MVFDLDGVLVDTKEIHFRALNMALAEVDPKFEISVQEHLSRFDGLDTRTKLIVLQKEKGLPASQVQRVWERKQETTRQLLVQQEPQTEIRKVFALLKTVGFFVGVASNSIRDTVDAELKRLQITDLVDFSLSNEDVHSPKPHPEIYWRAMMACEAHPSDTWIVEDSSVGRAAAYASGANVVPVGSSSDVTVQFAEEKLLNPSENRKGTPWHPPRINVLIPMAGAGSRFANAGYTFPKPLIEIFGRSMIEVVVRNLNIEGRFIFLVQKEHNDKYHLEQYTRLLKPGSEIVVVDGVTDGAARTALLAEEMIDCDTPLLIANSDQFVQWDSNEILYQLSSPGCDGGIVTFSSTHPKWSFARVDEGGWVTEVAEKNPISDVATTGIYYWKRGSDFVKYAHQMIEKDARTNGEFYICPVYNEAIRDGLRIRSRSVERMWGLGTPEDLTAFTDDPVALQLLKGL